MVYGIAKCMELCLYERKTLRNKRKLRSMYELSLCKLVYDYCCMVDIETYIPNDMK